MKKENLILSGAALLVVFIGFVTLFRPSHDDNITDESLADSDVQTSYRSLSASELKKRLNSQEKIRMLDVRSPLSFNHEHVVNSSHADDREIDRLKSADGNKNQVIVLIGIGNSDSSAKQYYQTLSDAGYTDVYLLSGGFDAWKVDNQNTVSQGDPTSFSDRAKIDYISPDELKAIQEKSAGSMFLIDVRPPADYAREHIAGATSIPLGELESRKKDIPLSRKIIVYGNGNLDSFQGGVRLFDLGFPNCHTLVDGFESWKAKGFPVINGK